MKKLFFNYSSKKAKTCKCRNQLFKHAQRMILDNNQDLKDYLQKKNLQFSTQILNNLYKLNSHDYEFQQQCRNIIGDSIEQLTPILALNILENISQNTFGDEKPLLKKIYEYVCEFHKLFNTQQLQKIEKMFFIIDQKIGLGFIVVLDQLINESKFERLKYSETSNILGQMGLECPKNLDIQINHQESKVFIYLKNTQQRVVLYGINENYDQFQNILRMKKILLENKKNTHFLLQIPALKFNNLRFPSQKEQVLKMKIITQKIKALSSKNQDIMDLFQKFDHLSILNQRTMQFYVENQLQKEEFIINQSENIVYKNNIPDVFRTLIYVNSNEDKWIYLVDGDQQLIIEQIENKKSLNDLQNLFVEFRIHYLNELLKYMVDVNIYGCHNCGQGANILQNIEILQRLDQDFAQREKHISQNILKAIEITPNANFIGLINLRDILPVLKNFINNIQDFKQSEFQIQNYEDLLKQMNHTKASTSPLLDNQDKFHKLAIIYVLLGHQKIPSQFDENIEFQQYFQQYNQLLNPDSFSDILQQYQNQQCGAIQQIFL